MDDVIYIHVDHKFNDEFNEWMIINYGKHGEVKANRGKVHEYLGMTFDFTKKRKVKTNMDDYAEWMIIELPMIIIKIDTALTPDGNNIFGILLSKVSVKNKLKIYMLQCQEECFWPREYYQYS